MFKTIAPILDDHDLRPKHLVSSNTCGVAAGYDENWPSAKKPTAQLQNALVRRFENGTNQLSTLFNEPFMNNGVFRIEIFASLESDRNGAVDHIERAMAFRFARVDSQFLP